MVDPGFLCVFPKRNLVLGDTTKDQKRKLVTGGKIEFPAQIRLQILGVGLFFSAGAPLDFRGGPLDLPWGASGRLGGDFPADGPPSSQPAWGDPPHLPFFLRGGPKRDNEGSEIR